MEGNCIPEKFNEHVIDSLDCKNELDNIQYSFNQFVKNITNNI